METVFAVSASGVISDGKHEYTLHEIANMLNHMEHKEKMFLNAMYEVE